MLKQIYTYPAYFVFSICLCVLSGCTHRTQPSVTTGQNLTAAMQVAMRVDILQQANQRRIRKVRSQSMKIGERASITAGEEVLRIRKYNEEILTLPKMRASKDFSLAYTLPADKNKQQRVITVFGYSNVTYEMLDSSLSTGVLLFDSIFATLKKDGTLAPQGYIPTGDPQRYLRVPVQVTPKDMTFKHVTRTQVIAKSENQYVIQFKGKKGMSLLFELRHLKGGSRPKISARQQIAVPLGTPLIEINSHRFKIHTATPEFIDIERLT